METAKRRTSTPQEGEKRILGREGRKRKEWRERWTWDREEGKGRARARAAVFVSPTLTRMTECSGNHSIIEEV